jgi:cysteine synthase
LRVNPTPSGPISFTTRTPCVAIWESVRVAPADRRTNRRVLWRRVGTGGMLRGVSRALREAARRVRIVALEPASSPALTEGRGGPHRVEGIGTGSVPPHMQDRPYDEARAIEEADARTMAPRLAREEGLLVGTSSALNICAALQLARELGPGRLLRLWRSIRDSNISQETCSLRPAEAVLARRRVAASARDSNGCGAERPSLNGAVSGIPSTQHRAGDA